MAQRANERMAYFNGRIVPESQVLISFRDRSFRMGDAAFDMTRTFRGVPFKLREHVDRLYRSLRYLRIDPGLSPGRMVEISEEVLDRNRHMIDENSDYWLGQRISRGIDAVGDEGMEYTGPTVIVECTPLPLKAHARLYRDGIGVILPSVRRVSPASLSPRAKTHNYLNLIVGDLEAKAHNPGAWSVLLDANGNLAEGTGSNIFVVNDGKLKTPREQFVLPGISRGTVIELARAEGLAVEEADIDPFDAATADEIFLTSTSLCICPVRSINGAKIGDGTVPGAITKRITEAYIRYVGCDFVAQYTRHL